MHLRHNKKALAFSTLIAILVIIGSFIAVFVVTLYFAGKAEASTAETICRASVMTRERTTVELEVGGIPVTEVHLTPLLCRTLEDIKIPHKKDASKDDVMRESADLMARCWKEFGDGLVDDVFKEGSPIKNNCFICYIATTGKTSEFKDEISSEEFLKYMITTPYKVEIEADKCKSLGGVCVANKGDCIAKEGKWDYDENNLVCKQKYNQENNKKPICCYSDYSCWNNGGECKEKGYYSGFVEYGKWDCPSGKICYIKEDNYITYYRYIRTYNGKGNIIITTPIKPREVYAISFGSPTESCGFCPWIGAAVGAGVGIAFTIVTGGTGGAALPVLTKIGIAGAAATSYFVVKISSEEIAKLFNRDINTIYLTTLDEALAEERCKRVKDMKGD